MKVLAVIFIIISHEYCLHSLPVTDSPNEINKSNVSHKQVFFQQYKKQNEIQTNFNKIERYGVVAVISDLTARVVGKSKNRRNITNKQEKSFTKITVANAKNNVTHQNAKISLITSLLTTTIKNRPVSPDIRSKTSIIQTTKLLTKEMVTSVFTSSFILSNISSTQSRSIETRIGDSKAQFHISTSLMTTPLVEIADKLVENININTTSPLIKNSTYIQTKGNDSISIVLTSQNSKSVQNNESLSFLPSSPAVKDDSSRFFSTLRGSDLKIRKVVDTKSENGSLVIANIKVISTAFQNNKVRTETLSLSIAEDSFHENTKATSIISDKESMNTRIFSTTLMNRKSSLFSSETRYNKTIDEITNLTVKTLTPSPTVSPSNRVSTVTNVPVSSVATKQWEIYPLLKLARPTERLTESPSISVHLNSLASKTTNSINTSAAGLNIISVNLSRLINSTMSQSVNITGYTASTKEYSTLSPCSCEKKRNGILFDFQMDKIQFFNKEEKNAIFLSYLKNFIQTHYSAIDLDLLQNQPGIENAHRAMVSENKYTKHYEIETESHLQSNTGKIQNYPTVYQCEKAVRFCSADPRFCEYHEGDQQSNLILLAPYGGSLESDEMNSMKNIYHHHRSTITRNITLSVADKVTKTTGLRPHVIIMNLHPGFVDVGNLRGGYNSNDTAGKKTWEDFHNFVSQAKQMIRRNGLLINFENNIEENEATFEERNSADIRLHYAITESDIYNHNFNQSSIKCLANRVTNSFKMFRGTESLEHFLQMNDITAITESSHDKTIGLIEAYGSYYGGKVDAINILISDQNNQYYDDRFSENFTKAITAFLNIYYKYD